MNSKTMHLSLRAALALTLAATLACTALAQDPTAAGPTPRMADGKPDLGGVWWTGGDLGSKGYGSSTGGTPPATLTRLNTAFNAALTEPELAQRLAEIGTIAVADSTPASTAQFVAQELDRWKNVISQTGVKIERR